MDKPTFTSQQAAEQADVSYGRLFTLLHVYPHLKPVKKQGGSFQWTQDDIDAFVQWRKSHRKRKRKK